MSSERLFSVEKYGGHIDLTDYEALQRLFSMRGIIHGSRRGDIEGYRIVTLQEGQRNWVDFHFDEKGVLVEVEPSSW
jgi:hypothetical protein